jgi:transcriptional regulator with XRE-family HTH domain
MSFSDRVKAARTFAGLAQDQLADKAGMKQSSVWYMENGKGEEQRSKYTAGVARACGVNASWLADGIGDMLPDYYHVTDPRIAEALRIMESLPDYAVTEAVKSITGIANLVDHSKPNGTSG